MAIAARRGGGLPPAVHGAVGDHELAALGLSWAEIVDFSHNSNPFGPLPAVRRAVQQADVSRYPDPECSALRAALAGREHLEPDQVLCGNGANELFWLAALAFLERDDPVLVLGPTYGEYEQACRAAGARVLRLQAAPPSFRHDPAQIRRVVARQRPRLVFLCNPNNPTGLYLEPADLQALLAACEDALVVLDESYLAFVSGGQSPAALLRPGQAKAPNLLLVRSLTKDHALAGLRLGYALGTPSVIAALRHLRPHWNVNAVAQAAGLAAVAHAEQLATGLTELRSTHAYLAGALADLELEVLPSAVPFFLARVGDAPAFRSSLLRHGCVVRDCTSFGLPQYVRIATRTRPECERLIAAVRAVLGEQQPVTVGRGRPTYSSPR